MTYNLITYDLIQSILPVKKEGGRRGGINSRRRWSYQLVDSSKEKPWVMFIANNQIGKVGSSHILNSQVQVDQ